MLAHFRLKHFLFRIFPFMPNKYLMSFLEKIENAINNLLILLGNLLLKGLSKIIPKKVRVLYPKFINLLAKAIIWFKNLPNLILTKAPLLLKSLKSNLLTFDYKDKLLGTYKVALSQYQKNRDSGNISKFKSIFLAPFLIMGQWLRGLTPGQTLLLLSFTSASILASISILFSSQRLVSHHTQSREPASVDEEVLYERPAYYKKQHRHLDLTALRIPVYFANVNELRSLDIDFTATLSNRHSRMRLEKLEFQLRDHFILNVEPMVASFPLEEEGKEVLRKKLLLEINDFLINNGIEGEVEDLKLTYILAN